VEKLTLIDLDLVALQARIRSWGEPYDGARTYARHIWHWLYHDLGTSIHELEALPPTLRERLSQELPLITPGLLAQEVSPDLSTQKHLLQMTDGVQVESVLLAYRDRFTVCASTQVGCACGCDFCATGKMGFVRQLSAGEIIAQILHFRRFLGTSHAARLSNVVFMGMGEPLLNTENVLKAVQCLADPRGLALAPGRITLSTVGIVPGIDRLAEVHSRLPIKLAISLHAATDELRSALMPINRTYPLAQLFDAVRRYTERTGRRVFYEWVMIADHNDTEEQALALVTRLQELPSHVNLIQLNPTADSPYRPASSQALDMFAAILDRYAIPHTVRQRRGGGIRAGCGQLFTQQHHQCN